MVRALRFSRIIIAALLLAPYIALATPDSTADTGKNDTAQIYAAFLGGWAGKAQSPLNISKLVELPTPDEIKQYTECAREDGNERIRWMKISPDRDISGILVKLPNVTWIDAKKWHAVDPGALIAKGQSVDSAVDAGISHGLMTLSAITFNQQHDVAMFTYSFRCGSLCGNGGTIMFKRSPAGWVRSKVSCGGWES